MTAAVFVDSNVFLYAMDEGDRSITNVYSDGATAFRNSSKCVVYRPYAALAASGLRWKV
jgi:hypothetical protein